MTGPCATPHGTAAGGPRSSTSRALTSLARRGQVSHVPDGWMLHGEPPRELDTVSRTTGRPAPGD